jgi:hypothetical protein
MNPTAHIIPRISRYGSVSGWDVICAALADCLFFKTRGLASKWCKDNGYDVVEG